MRILELTEGATRVYRYEFDDWSDFLTRVADCSIARGPYSDSRRPGQAEFYGIGSFEGALELARKGWQEGADKVAELARGHFAKLSKQIERLDPVSDIEGSGIDIATFLSGEPECWMRFETSIQEQAGPRILRVVFNSTVSGGIDKEVMFARGAAAAALVELLEYAGCRVEVLAIPFCSGNSNFRVEASVVVKEPNQPVDMARIAFAMAHASFLRRLGFTLCEQSPGEFVRSLSSYYGQPSDSKESRRDADLYIGSALLTDSQWSDATAARKWILAELKKQGIEMSA